MLSYLIPLLRGPKRVPRDHFFHHHCLKELRGRLRSYILLDKYVCAYLRDVKKLFDTLPVAQANGIPGTEFPCYAHRSLTVCIVYSVRPWVRLVPPWEFEDVRLRATSFHLWSGYVLHHNIMPQDKLHIIIVGAGLGGLAASIGLSRAGHAVTMLEQTVKLGEVQRSFQSE